VDATKPVDSGEDGRLLYLAENLASLHAATDLPWLTGRFEFLGEHALGAALTALVLPDEGGSYRASKSASPRPASARDLWDLLDLDRISASEAAMAALHDTESSTQPRVVALTDLFGGAAASCNERAMLAPIAFNREHIGAGLFIVPDADDTATAIANVIAAHAAVAMYQLREREDARRLHSVDPQLWVPDEDFLVAQLKREVARARRYQRDLGVALLRLENESDVRAKFGDFYTGHLMRRIGGQLLASVRDTDVLGALAGAYAVIHTDTGPEGTQVSAQRLRDAVTKMVAGRFPEAPSADVSVSCASFPAHGETVEALIEHLTSPASSQSNTIAA
jgi:diguanylate cyclase (GGDEF)-like protein